MAMDPNTAAALPPSTIEALRNLPAALEPLTAERRWVVWRWETGGKGRLTKVPYRAAQASIHASSTDPRTWGEFDAAVRTVENGRADGVGYMLADAEIAAFDLDQCRNLATGDVADWAWEIVDHAASYCEVTPSGAGLRVIGLTAPGSEKVHTNFNAPGTSGSIYRRADRYITISGLELSGSARQLVNIDPVIDEFRSRLVAAPERPRQPLFDPSAVSAPTNSVEASHDALPAELERLIADGAADGDRSDQFHHVVGWLKDRGWTPGDIEAEMRRHPSGIAAKYLRPRDRLGREVARCFPKLADKPVRTMRRLDDGSLMDPETGEILPAVEPAPVPAAVAKPAPDPRDFPDRDLQVPGLVGEIADWILATSPKPIRLFATAAALMAVANLVARRVYCGAERTPCHFYMLTIAGTAGGKERPQEAVRQVLNAVGSYRLHAAEPSSSASLGIRLAERPVQVQIIDEIDRVFRKMGHKNSSSFEAELTQIYCTLWGKGIGDWEASAVISRAAVEIKRPSLSIYGATTFVSFYEHLKSKMVSNGFLNRFLVLPRFQRVPFNEDLVPADDVPSEIVEAARRLFYFQDQAPEGESARRFIPASAQLLDPAKPPPLFVIEMTPAATAIYRDCRRRDESKAVQTDTNPLLEAWSRAAEMTKRIAIVVACGRFAEVGLAGVVVDEGDMIFAARLVDWSMSLFVSGLQENMAENEHQANAKLVLGYIRKAGDAAIARERVYRLVDNRMKARDLDGIIDQLVEARQIERIAVPVEGRGRPKTLYRYIDE